MLLRYSRRFKSSFGYCAAFLDNRGGSSLAWMYAAHLDNRGGSSLAWIYAARLANQGLVTWPSVTALHQSVMFDRAFVLLDRSIFLSQF